MQFRLWQKMGMTVGFLPFSTVGYNISKTHDFEDVDNNGKWAESYNGDGGFHQVFVGLGYKVFNNLSVGANFSYLYGDITHQSMTAIGATDTRSIKLDKFSISDYKLDFGLQYTYKLNKKNTINVGAVTCIMVRSSAMPSVNGLITARWMRCWIKHSPGSRTAAG